MKTKLAKDILATNIRRLMDSHDILNTQTALARRAGIAQSSIQRVMAGAVQPQLDVIEAIATAYKVPVSQLLEEDSLLTQAQESPIKGFSDLPAPEQEKVLSYIRFLISEQDRESGKTQTQQRLISFEDLRNIPEEQLAQVMRAALRELNDNTHAKNESTRSETKPTKASTGNRH